MVIRNFADVKVQIRTVDILRANVVYKLTFPSGKTYIGMTIQPLETRLRAHCNSAFNPKDRIFDAPKSRAIRKYLTFSVDILYQGDNLAEQEIAFIKKFESFGAKGYNATSGGDGKESCKHSEETKRKISEGNKGEKNAFYGKEHSDESKSLISKSRIGKGVIPITQYTIDGKFIKNWPSTKEASVSLKIDSSGITKCLKNKSKTCKGFVWKYKEINKITI